MAVVINFNSISGVSTFSANNKINVGDTFIKDKYVGLGTITTADRNAGVGTAVGTLIYNESSGEVQIYKRDAGWASISASSSDIGLTATGGVISDYSDPDTGNIYRSHTFTSSGTFNVSAVGDFPANVEYLVVAGGGGGGGNVGGGGGAGGYRTNVPGSPGDHTSSVTFPVNPGSFPAPFSVTIGAGGAGGINVDPTPDGNDSSFGSITALKGGGGGARTSGAQPQNAGRSGGSGGGGCGGETGSTVTGGSSTAVTTPSPWAGPATQGKAGGAGSNDPQPAAGGGGGGAGGAGVAGARGGTYGGNGGDGLPNIIAYGPTNPVTYAGGGGGGVHPPAPGTSGGSGGSGGGGAGADSSADGNPATGHGSGGGGGSNSRNGGNGSSGIVVVRYRIGSSQTGTAKATGGAISYYGGKTIHTFTSSGTFATEPNWTSATVEYVVVGGGGAGGEHTFRGGGGGAGNYKTGTVPIGAHPVSTSIQVGAGGAPLGAITPSSSGNGTSSFFGPPITAPGGGMGGSWPNVNGQPGSSGGGAGGGPAAPGSNGGTGSGDPFPGTIGATPSNGWGHDGGATAVNVQQGGGGGGAGAIGVPNAPGAFPTTYGFGGAGVQVPTTFRNPASAPDGVDGGGIGTPGPAGDWYLAGGGNGGGYPTGVNPAVRTTRPAGGGGYGGIRGPGTPGPYEGGYPGVENTGGGGGGASSTTASNRSGSGGSGIVLIAYPS